MPYLGKSGRLLVANTRQWRRIQRLILLQVRHEVTLALRHLQVNFITGCEHGVLLPLGPVRNLTVLLYFLIKRYGAVVETSLVVQFDKIVLVADHGVVARRCVVGDGRARVHNIQLVDVAYEEIFHANVAAAVFRVLGWRSPNINLAAARIAGEDLRLCRPRASA